MKQPAVLQHLPVPAGALPRRRGGPGMPAARGWWLAAALFLGIPTALARGTADLGIVVGRVDTHGQQFLAVAT